MNDGHVYKNIGGAAALPICICFSRRRVDPWFQIASVTTTVQASSLWSCPFLFALNFNVQPSSYKFLRCAGAGNWYWCSAGNTACFGWSSAKIHAASCSRMGNLDHFVDWIRTTWKSRKLMMNHPNWLWFDMVAKQQNFWWKTQFDTNCWDDMLNHHNWFCFRWVKYHDLTESFTTLTHFIRI